MQDRLARLEAKLRAIDAWDEAYRQDKTHDEIDEVSYRARQEIMREIEPTSVVLSLLS